MNCKDYTVTNTRFFIVRNQVCYQDLEAHYDKNSYWMMNYDTVLGLEPQNMVDTISWCLNKTFTGDDGREYQYPAARRQACEDAYKGGMSYMILILEETFL